MSELHRDFRQTEIGPLPSEWGISRIKDKFVLINGFPFDSKSFDMEEGFPLIRIRDLNKSQTEARYKGEWVDAAAVSSSDLLIGMDGDFNIGRWLGSEKALLNQRTCCLRGEEYITKYAEYFLPLELKKINDVTYATTVKHLSSLEINKIKVPLPPRKELIKIVNFLDRETIKIDGLIQKQKDLINLLNESRYAIIRNAVAGSNSFGEKLIDSGIEWADKIPENWEVWKLATRFPQIGSGTTPKSGNAEFYADDGIPWLNTGDLNDGHLYEASKYITALALSEYTSLRIFKSPSVCIALYGATIGKIARLNFDTTVNQACCVISGRSEVELEFLFYILIAARPYILSLASGGGQPNISQEIIRTLRLPIPPVDEQEKIVNLLTHKLMAIDKLHNKVKISIELLQEHRASLISAAVTGKIDLREE